jgi:hypothetical protein
MLHRWSGPAMDTTTYVLFNPTPFFAPSDPGDIPVYLPFATPGAIKTVNCLYKNAKKYFVLYMYISPALFRMLNENIDKSFKVFNNPTLTGWNPMISTQLILASCAVGSILRLAEGKHIWENNKLFNI